MSPLTEPTRIVLAKSWDLAGFDADAAAYIQRVEWADTTPLEATTRTAINNFVVGCKADGTWSAIKASCILAGARTLAGALMPLVGGAPTNFNFVSGDYNRKTGLVGNGSTKYLNSNRNNNVDPQNSFHMVSYVSYNVATNTYQPIMGTIDYFATNLLVIDNRSTSGIQPFLRGLNYPGGMIPITQSGFIGASRNSPTTVSSRAGSTNYSRSSSSEPPDTKSIMIFSAYSTQPNNLSPTFSSGRIAFYSIGESLNLTLLDTRVTALITAIGTAF